MCVYIRQIRIPVIPLLGLLNFTNSPFIDPSIHLFWSARENSYLFVFVIVTD